MIVRISIDTIDEESHRRQIQIAPSLIFTHTDQDLRPYFKDKELITCQGSLVKIGSYLYLSVEFQIGSSHSQNNFGALQKESLLRFKLIDGEYISLYNIKSDHGHIDPYSGNTVFYWSICFREKRNPEITIHHRWTKSGSCGLQGMRIMMSIASIFSKIN